jgi:hypothetical protein
MGLYQTKELLHSKGNSNQTQKTAHRMGENICSFSSNKGLISRVYRKFKKIPTLKGQHPNKEMGT